MALLKNESLVDDREEMPSPDGNASGSVILLSRDNDPLHDNDMNRNRENRSEKMAIKFLLSREEGLAGHSFECHTNGGDEDHDAGSHVPIKIHDAPFKVIKRSIDDTNDDSSAEIFPSDSHTMISSKNFEYRINKDRSCIDSLRSPLYTKSQYKPFDALNSMALVVQHQLDRQNERIIRRNVVGLDSKHLSYNRGLSTPSEQYLAQYVKPKRKRANAKQLESLLTLYKVNPFPSTDERTKLAMKIGMDPRSVQIWFQNKRQAEKHQR